MTVSTLQDMGADGAGPPGEGGSKAPLGSRDKSLCKLCKLIVTIC
jgi:hypothetical protein